MKTSTKTFAIADTAANADYLTNTSEPLGETMTLNVGPSHPATIFKKKRPDCINSPTIAKILISNIRRL